MISQDRVHQAVNSAVAQIIAENTGAQGSLPTPPPEPSNSESLNEVQDLESKTISFDEVDSLKVANYLLRVRNERLVQEVEDRRRKLTALELDLVSKEIHEEFAGKYDIDTDAFDISIDAKEKFLAITAK